MSPSVSGGSEFSGSYWLCAYGAGLGVGSAVCAWAWNQPASTFSSLSSLVAAVGPSLTRLVSAAALSVAVPTTAVLSPAASVAMTHNASPLVASLVGNLAATATIFAFSLGANNSCVYDMYWILAPLPITSLWLYANPSPSWQACTAWGLVHLWALRYLNMAEDPSTKVNHEDWRYADFRRRVGSLYWPMSLTSFHLTPTLVVFYALSPLYPLLSGRGGPVRVPASFSTAMFLAGALTSLGGIALGHVADQQLYEFRRSQRPRLPPTPPPPSNTAAATTGNNVNAFPPPPPPSADGEAGAPSPAVLEQGIWAYSRHPNYFGEFCFWLGALGMGLSSGADRWMCGGVVVLGAFFRGASVPLMDERMVQRRPAYAATMSRVSAFMPWFRNE